MNPIQFGLIGVGVLLAALGVARARAPWRRYQALKAQDENVARYEAWRGGARSPEPSGASVAMDVLKRQAQVGAAILAAGVVLVFLGFFIR